jgi:molybdopterin-guanine dinucleotide biosynthesis protein B
VSERAVFGVTGWKNAGKTTLVERLVAEFVRRGWRVATIKHAHHTVDIDQPGTDSWRHRAAGANEVALVGGQRFAIMREQAEPTLGEVLPRLAPADLVLIEGFKGDPHPKIEVRANHTRPMDVAAHNIVAIAADQPPPEGTLPWFLRNDIAAIADFIVGQMGRRRNGGQMLLSNPSSQERGV